jgi:hypothetical protein
MTWRDMLPLPAQQILTACEAAADRTRNDRGEIGIVGAAIIAGGLALLALALVAAIKSKTHSWISQIPG